jgi:RNA polymerase sigma-32 factor
MSDRSITGGGSRPESDEPEVEVLNPEDRRADDESTEAPDLEPSDEELNAEVGPTVDLADELEPDEPVEAAETAALVPRGVRSIARYDAMQAYVTETRRYALLTPEEEHQLAVTYRESGDVEAARRLVTSNLRLVVKIAHEYRKAYRNLLDLVQEGNIGLMHAVTKFDPYRGVRLSSYAAWWIRAYILKFILNNWRMVKIGTTQVQRKLFFNLRKEMERLEAMGIAEPGPKLLAERLDVPQAEVESMQRRLAGSDLSLDAPVRGDEAGGATHLAFVTDQSAGPEVQASDKEFSALLREKLLTFGQTLKGRDREIFELRTLAEEPMTLQEIGDRYGITRERARQIERRMMDRLRDYLRQELGDAVDVALENRD